MTLAEARRMLSCKSNYALAKRLGVSESLVSRWKKSSKWVPDKWRPVVAELAKKD